MLLQDGGCTVLAAGTSEECMCMTVSLLNLGLKILQRQQLLGMDGKEEICLTLEPSTFRELTVFLWMTGWYRLWIPNCRLPVRPLFETLISLGEKHLVTQETESL